MLKNIEKTFQLLETTPFYSKTPRVIFGLVAPYRGRHIGFGQHTPLSRRRSASWQVLRKTNVNVCLK